MASPSQDNELPTGQQQPSTTWGDFNNQAFMVQQALGKLQTATLVRIEKCTNTGGLSPVGFVDVTPLVNQLDGGDNPTPHVTIFNVPYFRLQGGANAIIIDPEPGDIGMCAFASRDITKVKATKAQANPGSFRQYSFADALYLGGMLNGTPTQYVEFSAAGIRIHSLVKIKLDAPDILLEAQSVEINASASTTVTTPTFTVNGATTLNGAVSQTGGGASSFSGNCTASGNITSTGILQGAALVLTGGGGTPTTQFPGPVEVMAGGLTIDGGNLAVTGSITATGTIGATGSITTGGSVTATGNVTGQGTSLHTHTHNGVQPGSGNTGNPN